MLEFLEHSEAVMSNKTHLRVAEVAEQLGVSKSLVQKWIREKKLATDGRFGIAPKSPHRITQSEVDRIRLSMSNN